MQRKVFRVEQLCASGQVAIGSVEHREATDEFNPLRARADQRDSDLKNMKRELERLHGTVAYNKRELSALLGDGKDRRMARAAGELGAAVDGMEKATEKILKSAEVIDDSAKALTAALKTDYERGLTQDIQDHVVKIYEACNFQDLAGQRIGYVIDTLNMIEEQVTAMLNRCNVGDDAAQSLAAGKPSGRGLLNGPRLDGDTGHTSQSDIDEMFG